MSHNPPINCVPKQHTTKNSEYKYLNWARRMKKKTSNKRPFKCMTFTFKRHHQPISSIFNVEKRFDFFFVTSIKHLFQLKVFYSRVTQFSMSMSLPVHNSPLVLRIWVSQPESVSSCSLNDLLKYQCFSEVIARDGVSNVFCLCYFHFKYIQC